MFFCPVTIVPFFHLTGCIGRMITDAAACDITAGDQHQFRPAGMSPLPVSWGPLPSERWQAAGSGSPSSSPAEARGAQSAMIAG
jgi:hypothetical protein